MSFTYQTCAVMFLLASALPVAAQNLHGSYSSKFKRYQQYEPFAGTPADTWNEVAWKGDRVQTQLVLWSTNAPTKPSAVAYRVSPLTSGGNQIPAGQVQLRFEKYVKGDPQARTCYGYFTHPDSVMLADALSEEIVDTIFPDDPLKIWITVSVPAGTPAGIYTGTITATEDAHPLEFKINLTVVDKTLPPPAVWTVHLDLWQHPAQVLNLYNKANPATPIALWSDQHFNLFMPAYRLLAATGQDVITTHIKDGALGNPSMVRWILLRDGTWHYDYSAFDSYVSAMLNIGIDRQISAFSLVGWNEDVIPYWDDATGKRKELYAPIGSPTYAARWDNFLTQFKNHLQTLGWYHGTVLYMDEVSEEKMETVISVIRKNDATWKIGLAHVKEISENIRKEIYDLSGALGVVGGHTNPVSTFYTSCVEPVPNAFVTPDNNPAEMTWMTWFAAQQGVDGYLRWAYDFWRNLDPLDIRDGGNTAGDFSLIYRSSNTRSLTALSSIRLELLREGIQDFEKIKILRQQLRASTNPFDAQKLALLNAKVAQFTNTSGSGAMELVGQGQDLLKGIVTETAGYCRAYGGAFADYFVESVRSTNGSQQLNYASTRFPDKGYDYYTTTRAGAKMNSNTTLVINLSPASRCSRVKVWIDWNADNDFDDSGEEVFAGGEPERCTNPLQYLAQIVVPDATHTSPGIKRMRMRLADAWRPLQPCGEENFTATLDLEFVVTDLYCAATSDYNKLYYISAMKTTSCKGNNITYQAFYTPPGGYVFDQTSVLTVNNQNAIEVMLNTSEASRCARIKVWVDWNLNNIFDDSEMMFAAGEPRSCLNPTSYTFTMAVPSSAIHIGDTRMRVQLRDAWQDEPEPCLIDGVAGTTDFAVRISASKPGECRPIMLSPVPGGQLSASITTFQWTSNGLPVSNYRLLIGSDIWNESVVLFDKYTTGNSVAVPALPHDGRPINVLLFYQVSGVWLHESYVYRTYDTYCGVAGGTSKSYFVLELATSGGKENIKFATTTLPEGAYQHPQSNYVSAVPGARFSVDLQNSLASFCARTYVWIDWNSDNVFTDGEIVFEAGQFESCATADHFTFNVDVPATAVPGDTRMRIRVQDSWTTDILYPCGINTASGVADFDVKIIPVLATETESSKRIAAFPNPATNILTIIYGDEKSDSAEIAITDSMGRIVAIKNIQSSPAQINLQDYVPGVYLISVKQKFRVERIKIIKAK